MENLNKVEKLAELLHVQMPSDGMYNTPIDNLLMFRDSTMARAKQVYESGIIIVAQGKKNAYIGGKSYTYGAGDLLATFVPTPMEYETVDVSDENPFLCIGFRIDYSRLANILMKIDSYDMQFKNNAEIASSVYTVKASENILDAAIRLVKLLDNPMDAAALGNAAIDEIYYWLISREFNGSLRSLLQQSGQINTISKVVGYIQDNYDKPVNVDNLANMVNMSTSGFHKKFKDVMHIAPLQYIKSIKLNKAKVFILEGMNVKEAGYKVGYNSTAQFSREYKSYFGMSPSATRV